MMTMDTLQIQSIFNEFEAFRTGICSKKYNLKKRRFIFVKNRENDRIREGDIVD